jgi:hypothetical protein
VAEQLALDQCAASRRTCRNRRTPAQMELNFASSNHHVYRQRPQALTVP